MEGWNIRLKAARNKKNLTLKGVTEHINITQQSLIDYEKGKVYPKLDMFMELCELYEVSMNYIVYGNDAGFEIENELKKNLQSLVSMMIFNRISYDEEAKSFSITDERLAKNFKFFTKYFKDYPMRDFDSLDHVVHALKTIKDDYRD